MERRIWPLWLALIVLLAGCGGVLESGTPAPPPTVTPRPWRPPTVPITLENVTGLALLGINRLPTGGAYHFDFSDDGRLALTVGADDTVRLWDATTGQLQWAIGEADTTRAFFVLDDTQVVLIRRDNEAALYDVTTTDLLRTFRLYPGRVGPAAVSPDGRLLAVGAVDGIVTIWDLEAGRQAAQFEAHAAPVEVVQFGADGTFLATSSDERVIRLWNVAEGRSRAVLADFDRSPEQVALSPDGSLLAMSTDNEVRVWATGNGAPVQVIQTELRAAIRQVAIAPQGWVLGGGLGDGVEMWSLTDGSLFAALPDHGENFKQMAISPTAPLVVTVAFPGRVFLWNLDNPNQRFQLSAQADQISLAGWTPDGRVLLLSAADGGLWFWGIPGEPVLPVTPTPED
ncbi:MAG: PQQ-binding-like beta-propeller repeat protein [Anaerolineae bacterium]|nr:PQQ-binding-like beta-propeller repeat protein [Anaerolineae bacterium]